MERKVCFCCGRKAKLFEPFEHIAVDDAFDLCNECSQLIYKMKDDASENNKEDYDIHVKELETRKKGNENKIFAKWYSEYKENLDKKFKPKS